MFSEIVERFLTRVVLIPVRIVAGALVARAIGAEGRGAITLVMTTALLLGVFADVGLGWALAYVTGQGRLSRGRALGASLVLSVAAGIGCAALFPPLFWLLRDTAFLGVPAGYAGGALLAAVLNLVAGGPMALLLSMERHRAVNAVAVVGGLLGAAVNLFVVFVLHAGVGGLVVALCVNNAVGFLLVAWALGPDVWREVRVDVAGVRELGTYGSKGKLGDVAQFLSYRVDNYLVNFWHGHADLGLYGVAISLAESVRLLPSAVDSILFPRMANEEREDAIARARVYFHHMLILVGAMAIGLAAVGWWVIPALYGDEFDGSVLPFYLLLPGLLVYFAGAPFNSFLAGHGWTWEASYSSFWGLAVTIVADVLLIPHWGGRGAALASSISYATSVVVSAIYFCRLTGTPPATLVPRPAEIAAYLAALLRRVRGSRA